MVINPSILVSRMHMPSHRIPGNGWCVRIYIYIRSLVLGCEYANCNWIVLVVNCYDIHEPPEWAIPLNPSQRGLQMADGSNTVPILIILSLPALRTAPSYLMNRGTWERNDIVSSYFLFSCPRKAYPHPSRGNPELKFRGLRVGMAQQGGERPPTTNTDKDTTNMNHGILVGPWWGPYVSWPVLCKYNYLVCHLLTFCSFTRTMSWLLFLPSLKDPSTMIVRWLEAISKHHMNHMVMVTDMLGHKNHKLRLKHIPSKKTPTPDLLFGLLLIDSSGSTWWYPPQWDSYPSRIRMKEGSSHR